MPVLVYAIILFQTLISGLSHSIWFEFGSFVSSVLLHCPWELTTLSFSYSHKYLTLPISSCYLPKTKKSCAWILLGDPLKQVIIPQEKYELEVLCPSLVGRGSKSAGQKNFPKVVLLKDPIREDEHYRSPLLRGNRTGRNWSRTK